MTGMDLKRVYPCSSDTLDLVEANPMDILSQMSGASKTDIPASKTSEASKTKFSPFQISRQFLAIKVIPQSQRTPASMAPTGKLILDSQS